MALKLAGETDNYAQEKIETIAYDPYVPDTGDLEVGTHTIVPTSRPAIGSAQYSKALTLPKPSDARLVVLQIAARLSVNIAGLGTATHVYCNVRVDVDDADHELFSEDWTTTGAKLDGVNKTSGVLFDLLKDGAAHTFYFLFWADAANQATIDVVQLWEGVGTYGTGAAIFWQLNYSGLVWAGSSPFRVGSGLPTFAVCISRSASPNMATWIETIYRIPDQQGLPPYCLPAVPTLYGLHGRMYGSVATDLYCINNLFFVLRSER